MFTLKSSALALACAAPAPLFAQPRFKMTDLGTIPGTSSSWAVGIHELVPLEVAVATLGELPTPAFATSASSVTSKRWTSTRRPGCAPAICVHTCSSASSLRAVR